MNDSSIPISWAIAPLNRIAKFIDYRGKTPKKVESGVPLITAKNVKKGYLSIDPKEFIEEGDYESWMTRGIPSKNDVLITTEAPLGNVCCVPELEKFALAQRIINLKIDRIYLHGKFLMYQILSSDFQNDLIKNATGTTVKGIKASKLKEIAIKVPPRAEQERIVRKIETCFEKIDSTEQNLTKIETLLEKYRESLLTKAFRGELIPQDPNDEPARVLLEKIRAERAKNQKGKKKAQEFAPVSDDEKPFDIPESWEWVRLESILEIQSGNTPRGLPSVSDGHDIQFIKVGDMNCSRDGISIDQVSLSLSNATASKLGISILPAGAIIFPKRGGAILTNKKRILRVPSGCDTNIMGLIIHQDVHDYFWWWFQSINLGRVRQ